jgi:hypothetical protein
VTQAAALCCCMAGQYTASVFVVWWPQRARAMPAVVLAAPLADSRRKVLPQHFCFTGPTEIQRRAVTFAHEHWPAAPADNLPLAFSSAPDNASPNCGHSTFDNHRHQFGDF